MHLYITSKIHRAGNNQYPGKIKIKDHMCFKGKVILELIFSSALRPREIYNLKLIDIDFMADILFIERSQNR